MAIAVQSDPNDIRELKEMFQALDADGNGTVSFEELEQGLGDRENRDQLIELLRAADTDNSGTINYSGKRSLHKSALNPIHNQFTLIILLYNMAEFLAATMD